MRTSGAEREITDRKRVFGNRLRIRVFCVYQSIDGIPDKVWIQFTDARQRTVGTAGECNIQLVFSGNGFHIMFQNRIHFLENKDLSGRFQIGKDVFFRQRPDGCQAQKTDRIFKTEAAQRFAAVKASGTTGNNQLFCIFRTFIMIIRTGFKNFLCRIQCIQHGLVQIIDAAHSPTGCIS